MNFYEGWMPRSMVESSLTCQVEDLVAKLDELAT